MISWNKRIARRRTLVFYLEVFDRNDGRLLGRIGDLTEHGLALLHSEKLEPEAVHQVSISVPTEIHFPVTSLEVTFCIQWTRVDKNPALWAMGCRFLDLNSETRALILRLIDELGFADFNLAQRIAFD